MIIQSKLQLAKLLKTDLFYSATLVIVWRILLEGYAIFVLHRFPFSDVITKSDFPLTIWMHWDGGQYTGIARDGYLPDQYPFFPLLPLLIKIVSLPRVWLQGSQDRFYFQAGVLITTLALIFGIYFLIKVGRTSFSEQSAKRAVLLLLFFPSAIFLGSIYTESLFLMSVLGSFYYASQKRWVLATLFACAATLSRIVGVTMLVCLALEFYLTYKDSLKSHLKQALIFLLIPATLGLYMLYQFVTVGNPFSFLNQKSWGREFSPTFFIEVYNKMVYALDLSHFDSHRASALYDTIPILFFSALLYPLIKEKRYSFALYMAMMIIFPLSSGQIYGMIRYGLIMFPGFLILGKWCRNQTVFAFLLAFFAIFFAVLSIHFLNNWWLA